MKTTRFSPGTDIFQSLGLKLHYYYVIRARDRAEKPQWCNDLRDLIEWDLGFEQEENEEMMVPMETSLE